MCVTRRDLRLSTVAKLTAYPPVKHVQLQFAISEIFGREKNRRQKKPEPSWNRKTFPESAGSGNGKKGHVKQCTVHAVEFGHLPPVSLNAGN